MPSRISDLIGEWISSTIDEVGNGEKILWECGLVSGDAPEGQVAHPNCLVVIWYPGPLLGDVLRSSFVIDNPLTLTKAETVKVVTQFVEKLAEARSERVEAYQQDLQAQASAQQN